MVPARPLGSQFRNWRVAGIAALLAAPVVVSACQGTIGEPGAAPQTTPPGTPPTMPPPRAPCGERVTVATSSRAPRLTHAQWENTVQDLLRLPALTDLSREFTADGDLGGDLFVDERLWAAYQTASETIAARVATDPTALARLVPPGAPATGAARVRALVADLGRRAYRRPLTDAELARHVALFDSAATMFEGRDPFSAGVELTIRALLQSPRFLYRLELTAASAPDGVAALDDFEVASRLAYALWNTMPDDALLDLAARGELRSEQAVRAQAVRLLRDERARAVVRAFHAQYLHLDALANIEPNAARIPAWRPSMRASLAGEFERFVDDVTFAARGGFAQLMSADYTFANADVATIYGLAGTFTADEYRRVALPPERRGVLAQAGFLAAHGGAYHPDSIHRGVRMANEVLCIGLGDPPEGIPPLPFEAAGTTNRQRVNGHTSAERCVGCHHTVINPLGFAFENFDALGQYRTREAGGLPIDATGSIAIDGARVEFDGPVRLVQAIATSAQGNRCYVGQWVRRLAGRPTAPEDACLVERLGDESRRGLPIVELVASVLASPEFRSRR